MTLELSEPVRVGDWEPFYCGTGYAADGYFYVFGGNATEEEGGADNSPYTRVVRSLNLLDWEDVVRGTSIDYRAPDCGKIHLPDGRSGYWGWYCYRDNNAQLYAENALYYYFQETHTPSIDDTLFRRVAPTLSNGGNYFFAAGLAALPIIRGDYVYWLSWLDPTQAIREAAIPNATTGNRLRIWRAPVSSIGQNDCFTTYADIGPIPNCYMSEPDWVETNSGEIIIVVRVESSNATGGKKGTFITRSSNFLNWSSPSFLCNGFPPQIFKDFDGTIYVAAAERGSGYGGNRWDSTSGSQQECYALTSTDNGATFSAPQVVANLNDATGGYSYFGRYKNKLIHGFYQDPSGSEGQYVQTQADAGLNITINVVDSLTLQATANGHDITADGLWYSSNPTSVKVFNGVLTPLSDGSVTITFDYAGYLATTEYAPPGVGTCVGVTTGTSTGVLTGAGITVGTGSLASTSVSASAATIIGTGAILGAGNLSGTATNATTEAATGSGVAIGLGQLTEISTTATTASIEGIGQAIIEGAGTASGVTAETSVESVTGTGVTASSINQIRAPNNQIIDLRDVNNQPITMQYL